MKREELMRREGLMPLPKSAELLVTRNTKGNLLPGHTQRMTVKEAVEYGAWDTSQGTMEFCVELVDSEEYEPPVHKNVFLFQGVPVVRFQDPWEVEGEEAI